jgi:hypothetical protein
LAVPTDGEGHISRFASKPQLFNVAAGAAAILNHSTAFGIWIASFDLHRPNAGNACDEISEEAVAFSFGFDGRHGSNYTPSERLFNRRQTRSFRISIYGEHGRNQTAQAQFLFLCSPFL